jgi:anti-sigma factor RsiW
VAEEPETSAGISDEELSAYLDGSVTPFRRAQIDAAARADPHLAKRLKAYRAQEEGLRKLAAAVLEEPVPDHLLEVVRRPRPLAESSAPAAQRAAWWRRLLPLAASLLVGVALGWLLRPALQPDEDSLLEPFLHQAALSHELFLTSGDLDDLRSSAASGQAIAEVRSPFRTPIRVPPLLGDRYRPVQYRAVEGEGGPALQLAYASEDGLASLLVRPHAAGDDLSARFATIDGRAVLYWLDGPLIYALVGDGSEAELRAMARSIYASTATGGSWQPLEPAPAQPASTTQP